MWVVAGILSFAPGFAGAAGGLMEGSLAVLGTLNKLDVTSYFGAFAFNTFGAILGKYLCSHTFILLTSVVTDPFSQLLVARV